MKRFLRYPLVGFAFALAVPYSGAVGFLALRETSLVYVSAGRSPVRRAVPDHDAGIAWDTLRVRADDGVPVLLLESRVDDAPTRPWVVYFHGNAGLLGSRGNVDRYRLLRDAGFNVLAVEYRGYGASIGAGSPSEAGLSADARAAWRHLTETRRVPAGRVAVYGWSLGSGPAMYLAAEMRPGAVVTEGAFTSLPDVGAEQYPWVPVRLIMRNRFDNIGRGRALELPWIIFHARTDDIIPFAHAERLAAAARSARLVSLAGTHDNAVTVDPDVTLPALRDLAQRLAQ